MKAFDRTVKQWMEKVRDAEITLPSFQRKQAWRVANELEFLASLFNGFPVGAALVLRVIGTAKFASRLISTAPPPHGNTTVLEQLLDGQQRITTMWKYFNDVDLKYTCFVKFNRTLVGGTQKKEIIGQARKNINGQLSPAWVGDAKQCYAKELIPLKLFNPIVDQNEVSSWVDSLQLNDANLERAVERYINAIRNDLSILNLPVLELEASTSKADALDIFVKLNTSFVRLSAYDLVVALVEKVASQSLHQKVDDLAKRFPLIDKFGYTADLLMDMAALLQDVVPSRNMYEKIDANLLLQQWKQINDGFDKVTSVLEGLNIFELKFLPTYTPLAVIGAIHAKYNVSAVRTFGAVGLLLQKYVWRAFLTDRYESSSSTNAYADYIGIKKCINSGVFTNTGSIPIFSLRTPDFDTVKNASWPSYKTILGRGLLAIQLERKAKDLATGDEINQRNSKQREYHHLYPKALLSKCNIIDTQINSAMNCALVGKKTNGTFSGNSAYEYLKNSLSFNMTPAELADRVATHLIPLQELQVNLGQQDASYNDRVKKCFDDFINQRAKMFIIKINSLL